MAGKLSDPAEAEELFVHVFPQLAGWAARLVGAPDEGRDIAAESFVRLLSSGGPVLNGRAFLFATAANLIKDRWRGQERRRRALRDLTLDPLVEPAPDVSVRDAVQRLPRGQRVPVLLFYYADLSTKEIAEATGKPEGTVRRQLSEARRRLRAVLEEVPAVD